MFGVIHACQHTLDDELLAQWQAHLCGLCLSLRDSRGQLSRALTNTDAVLLSVLVEAQQPGAADRTTAGRCPLRGMRTAQVVPAKAVAARLGATASVTLAAAKAGDVRAEQVHLLATPTIRARAIAAMAGPLRRSALLDTEMADAVQARKLLDDLAGQAALESAIGLGDPLLAVTAPTARATGRIFASSAVLAGRTANEEPLREVGEAFGALAHLLDAVEDLPADQRSGAFNPIRATGGSITQARRLAHQLVRQIGLGFELLQLHDGRLARALLVDGTRSAVHRTFAAAGAGSCGASSTGPHFGYPGPAANPPPDAPTGPGQTPPIPPPPPKEPPRPAFWSNVLPWIGVYCTGYACCASHQNPCTGKQHQAGCSRGDGGCSECCDCDGCCCDCN
jgi:hypothetical protein